MRYECKFAAYPICDKPACIGYLIILNTHTVKPVLSGHSKIDKTKILMTNGSLMKVECIAEFCNTFDLH